MNLLPSDFSHFLLPALLILFPLLPLPAAEPGTDYSGLPDSTAELREQLEEGDGSLLLAPGRYRITETLRISLEQRRSAHIAALAGPVTLIMDGPGPAIRIVGSHQGTAGPTTFEPSTWNERMPRIEGIEIFGVHPEADGIQLLRCVQPIISRVAIRNCRHGVHLIERNRNVILSDLQIYENSGVGIYLDDVNLHQINIANSHVSYNRSGGIVVADGNVRNLHITGCDLEANMPDDDTPTETANILLDVSESTGDRTRSIAEVSITGCTIQHSSNYGGDQYDSVAPGGANIRIHGKPIWPIDSIAISGNVVSDTSVLVDLNHATDVTITGNTFFAPNPDFLHALQCRRLVLNGNTWNPRQFERPGRLVFERCHDSVISDNTFRALRAEEGALQLIDCERILARGNILTESSSGVRVENSTGIDLRDWIVSGLPDGVNFLEKDEHSSARGSAPAEN